MIADLLTETVTWRAPGSPDFYGDSTPTDTPIEVRWENRRQMVRDASGSEVVSEATVYCIAPVQTGHTLVDSGGGVWPVVGVSEQKDLTGKFSHYEVVL